VYVCVPYMSPMLYIVGSLCVPSACPSRTLYPCPPPGLQALRLTADFIRIVTDYLRAIRPLCYDEAGVLPAPSLSGDAPLFVNPSTGLRLTRMSRLLAVFFQQTLGLRLHSTRLRSILFTAVATTCSSTAVQEYAAGDTHRGKGVRDLWGRCRLPPAACRLIAT